MRHLLVSPDFRAGAAEMLPANIGLIPFGLVCGVGAASAGADWLAAWGMAAIIFSGAAQILSAQLLAADAPIAIIVLTCFVAGLRFFMYSAAMAPYLKPLPARGRRRSPSCSPIRHSPPRSGASMRRTIRAAAACTSSGRAYRCGLRGRSSCMAGFFAGFLVPASWSLEFAVPLCFIALVAPLMRNAASVGAAIVAGVAVLALEALPMKLNLIAAGGVGIVAGTLVRSCKRRWRRR